MREKPDKRRHKRTEIVKVMGNTSYRQSNQPIEFDSFVTNISQSGICLLTTEILEQGQEIHIENHIVHPPKTATVRWSKVYYGLYYSYGLEFH